MAKKCACNLRHVGPCADPRAKFRTQEEIGQEYARVCTEIGDLEYRLKRGIPDALDDLYARAKTLNLEANAAAKAAQEEQANG